MGVSRVQKFKEYRDSLIKEETPVLETPKSSPKKETAIDQRETTSTLPMDEVIETLQNDEEEVIFLKKAKRKQMLFVISLCAIGVVLIAGIIVFGVLVWR